MLPATQPPLRWSAEFIHVMLFALAEAIALLIVYFVTNGFAHNNLSALLCILSVVDTLTGFALGILSLRLLHWTSGCLPQQQQPIP